MAKTKLLQGCCTIAVTTTSQCIFNYHWKTGEGACMIDLQLSCPLTFSSFVSNFVASGGSDVKPQTELSSQAVPFTFLERMQP